MPQDQSSTHFIYVVAGPAGSGKSTLGRALARTTGALLLDQDVATNPLMAQLAALVGAGDDLDHPMLRGPIRQARYQCLIDIAADNGRLGRDAVLIAPFTAECADAGAWSEFERQLAPAQVSLIWVSVPPEVALARRVRRNLARDRNAAPRTSASPVVAYLAASGSADPRAEAVRVAGLAGGRSGPARVSADPAGPAVPSGTDR